MVRFLTIVFLILAVCFTAFAGTITTVTPLSDWSSYESSYTFAGPLNMGASTHQWGFSEQMTTTQAVSGVGSNADLLYITTDKAVSLYERFGKTTVQSFNTDDYGGSSMLADAEFRWSNVWNGTQLVSNGDLTVWDGNGQNVTKTRYISVSTWECILSTCTSKTVWGETIDRSIVEDTYWAMTNFGNTLGVTQNHYEEIFPTVTNGGTKISKWERWAPPVVEAKKTGGNYMLPPPPPPVAPVVSLDMAWATSAPIASADEPVPEPGTMALGITGAVLMFLLRRKA
jgi:hypothetical protein